MKIVITYYEDEATIEIVCSMMKPFVICYFVNLLCYDVNVKQCRSFSKKWDHFLKNDQKKITEDI